MASSLTTGFRRGVSIEVIKGKDLLSSAVRSNDIGEETLAVVVPRYSYSEGVLMSSLRYLGAAPIYECSWGPGIPFVALVSAVKYVAYKMWWLVNGSKLASFLNEIRSGR